jgi:hypothetical protein
MVCRPSRYDVGMMWGRSGNLCEMSMMCETSGHERELRCTCDGYGYRCRAAAGMM